MESPITTNDGSSKDADKAPSQKKSQKAGKVKSRTDPYTGERIKKQNDEEIIRMLEAEEAEYTDARSSRPICSLSELYFPGEEPENEDFCACNILLSTAVQAVYPGLLPSRTDPDACDCQHVIDDMWDYARQNGGVTELPRAWFFSKSALGKIKSWCQDSRGGGRLIPGQGLRFSVHEFVDVKMKMRSWITWLTLFIVAYRATIDSTSVLSWVLSLQVPNNLPNALVGAMWLITLCLFGMLYVVLWILWAMVLDRLFHIPLYFAVQEKYRTLIHRYEVRLSNHGQDPDLIDRRSRTANFAANPLAPNYLDLFYSSELVNGHVYQESLFARQAEAPHGVTDTYFHHFEELGRWIMSFGLVRNFAYFVVWAVYREDEPIVGPGSEGIRSWRPLVPIAGGRASEELILQMWGPISGLVTRDSETFRRYVEMRVANNTHVNVSAGRAFYESIHWNSVVITIAYAYSRRQCSGLADYVFREEEQ